MSFVYKYQLAIEDEQEVELPYGAKILHVEEQRGTWCLWALVSQHSDTTQKRLIRVAGTGHPIHDEIHHLAHISTFTMNGGALVFHAFEIIR